MDNPAYVTLPQEDFRELQASAMTAATTGERIAGTVQTTLVFAALAGAFTAGCFGVAKAQDWLEEKKFQRSIREREYAKNNK